MRFTHRKAPERACLALLFTLALLLPAALYASDHADPSLTMKARSTIRGIFGK